MPHCIIEYAVELEAQIDIKKVIETIHKDMVLSNLFDDKTIKIRAVPVSKYLIGGVQNPFVHITIKLLAGRTVIQKQNLAKKVLKTVSELFVKLDEITLEIIALNPDFYFKRNQTI